MTREELMEALKPTIAGDKVDQKFFYQLLDVVMLVQKQRDDWAQVADEDWHLSVYSDDAAVRELLTKRGET